MFIYPSSSTRPIKQLCNRVHFHMKL